MEKDPALLERKERSYESRYMKRLHRWRNPATGETQFRVDYELSREIMTDKGWKYQGVEGYVSSRKQDGMVRLYRFVRAKDGAERYSCTKDKYSDEGFMPASPPVLGWVHPTGIEGTRFINLLVYRNNTTGAFVYTCRTDDFLDNLHFTHQQVVDANPGSLLIDARYELCMMFQNTRVSDKPMAEKLNTGTNIPIARPLGETPIVVEREFADERDAIIRAVVRAGLSFQLARSYDGDEDYLLLTLPPWRFDLEGERLRVRVTRRITRHGERDPPQSKLTSYLWGGVKQCDDTGYAGYAPFDSSRKDEFIGVVDDIDPTSIFRSSQRQHILMQVLEKQVFPFGFYYKSGMLAKNQFYECEATAPRLRPAHFDEQGKEIHHDDKEYLNLAKALKKSVVTKLFPLHEDKPRNALKEEWAKNWRKQPLTKIRNYFGGNVAFYFAWLGFYTTWLYVPAILGLGLFILQMLTRIDAVLLPVFCLFMALWSVCFLEYWKRQQATLAFKWGTGLGSNFSREEVTRPEHYGKLKRSVVTGEFETHYPVWKRRVKMFFITPVLVVFVGCVVVFIIGMLEFKSTQEFACGSLENCQNPIASVSTSIFILIMNKIYGYVAVALTNWENHRTDTRYENSLILKTFAFQFVNSFSALFYLAFQDQDLPQLALQLASNLFVKEIFMQLKEFFLPWAMRWWAWRSESKNRAKLEKAGHHLAWAASYELEEHLPVLNGTIDDFAEMMIQYGYVTLFVAAFPLAPLAALINDLFEIRVDATKYCSQVRRPVPHEAQDIGSWMAVLTAITGVAVVTNAALLTISSNEIPKYFPGITFTERVWMLFLIEHVVFAVQVGIAFLVPNTPAWVKREAARQEYDADREFHDLLDEHHAMHEAEEVAHESDVDDDAPESARTAARTSSTYESKKTGPLRERAPPQAVPPLEPTSSTAGGSRTELPGTVSSGPPSTLPPIHR